MGMILLSPLFLHKRKEKHGTQGKHNYNGSLAAVGKSCFDPMNFTAFLHQFVDSVW